MTQRESENTTAALSALQELRARLRSVAKGRPLISIPEVARVLGNSRASAYRSARAGTLPTVRVNRRVRRVSVVALERMLSGETD